MVVVVAVMVDAVREAPPQQLLSSAVRSDGLFLASGAEAVALLLLRTMALELPQGLPTASRKLLKCCWWWTEWSSSTLAEEPR